MLKDFLKAYAVAVLVAIINATALWIVGADSIALQIAMTRCGFPTKTRLPAKM